jgi:hypothetical protein
MSPLFPATRGLNLVSLGSSSIDAYQAARAGDLSSAGQFLLNGGLSLLRGAGSASSRASLWAGRAQLGLHGFGVVQGAARGVEKLRAGDWLGAGLDLAEAAVNLKRLLRPCFPAGTPLRARGGDKPIEQFRAGDRLLSRPEDDPAGTVEEKVVEEVFVRAAPVLNLHVRGRVIRVTAEHPLWVWGKGWLAAAFVESGDLLSSDDGQCVAVDAVTDSGEVTTVYTLRVADYHTYFVGSEDWGFSVWAHNSYRVESKSYASSEQGLRLRKDAMALRGRLSGDTTYRNIATAEVTINGRTTTVKFANTPDVLHSEEKLVAWYTAMRNQGKSVTVNAVYTDRIPCRTCNSLLTNTFGSNLTVFHAQGPGPFRP